MMDKELAITKEVLRKLLAHQIEERGHVWHRIYDLEKKGGKKSETCLRIEEFQKKEEEENSQFLSNLQACRERRIVAINERGS